MSFEGKPAGARQISGNQRDGWILGMRYENQIQMAKWGVDGNITQTPLNWPEAPTGGYVQGLVDGRLIFGGLASASGPYRFGEFDLQTNALKKISEVGTTESQHATCTEIPGVGLAGVVFDKTTSESGPPNIVFHAFLRFVKDGEPGWWSQRFEYPAHTGFGQAYHLTSCMGPDGLLWVFFTRDSGKTIGLIRFGAMAAPGVAPDYLCLYTFSDEWVPQEIDGVSCSGESPPISATFDERNRRILLMYQCWPDIPPTCPGNTNAYRWSVAEVTLGHWAIQHRLIATSDWIDRQEDFPVPSIWPRREGNYFLARGQSSSDCAYFWQPGILSGDVFHKDATLPDGKVVSTSPDGWVLLWNRATNTSDIVRIHFLPELTLPNGAVDWNPFHPGDVLEQSADLVNWHPMPYAGRPPVPLAANQAHAFLRVRRPA